MKFPSRPTCHPLDGVFSPAFKRHPSWPKDMPDICDDQGYIWRQGGYRETVYEPDGEVFKKTDEIFVTYPFRTCSYCGSIHPEDLLHVIDAGATLGGSDWKYGWPHKFYVDGIPNPEPDRLYVMGSMSEGGKVTRVDYGKRPTLHAKWYNLHLRDAGFDEEAFMCLTTALQAHAGITFTMEAGKLKYAAPWAGYQR